MTFAGLIDKAHRLPPLLLILAIGAFLRLYQIKERFSFDYDQEVSAQAAWEFFKNGKVSLIGQELSFQGFFLGPLHNWIQFIPYGLCNLKPDCVPYFYAVVGLLTITLIYLILKSIFNLRVALISSAIYAISLTAISYEWGVNSNFFLLLSTLLVLYCLYKYFQQENIYLVIGGLLSGIAIVNFNPIFIFNAFAFFLTSLLGGNKSWRLYSISIFALFLNYMPLVIFNFRHDNILWHNFLNFIEQNINHSNYILAAWPLLSRVTIPFFTYYVFHSTHFLLVFAMLILTILGSYRILTSKNKYLIFLVLAPLINYTGLIFYKGHIPDYYFQLSALSVLIMMAIILSRYKILFIIFVSIFLWTNINQNFRHRAVFNYQIKKQVVNYIIADTSPATFNVYFDFLPGLNTGYEYLFKINKRLPVEGGENLYVVGAGDDSYFLKYRFQRSYPEKNVKEKIFNNAIRVISIVD